MLARMLRTGTARRSGYGLMLLAGLVGCQATDKPSTISLPPVPPAPNLAPAHTSATATPKAAWSGSTVPVNNATDLAPRSSSALPVSSSTALPVSEPSSRSRTGTSPVGQNPPISVGGVPTTGGNLTPTTTAPINPVTASGWTPSNSPPTVTVTGNNEPARPNYAPPSGIKNPLPIDLPTPPGPPAVTVPSNTDIVPPALPSTSRDNGVVPPANLPSVLPTK